MLLNYVNRFGACSKLSSVSKIVQISYWSVWVLGVLYSLFIFCLDINDKVHLLDPYDFEDGWQIFQRKKDISDVEWTYVTGAFKKYWVLLLIHSLVIQIVLINKREFIPGFHVCYSVCSLFYIGGPIVCAEYLGYILLILCVANLQNLGLCYIITMTTLFVNQMKPISRINENFVYGKEENFLIEIGFIWLLARGLSFSSDWIKSSPKRKMTLTDIISIFSYCLYMPVIFTGPLTDYDSFRSQIGKEKFTQTNSRKLLYPFMETFGCYIILEILLHFVYSSATQFYPDIVIGFNSWSLGGMGYALPMLFFLKYSVIYGLPFSLAQLEGIELPPPPSCISCIHRPSLLWKSFDPGLYQWLYRYIYHPLYKQSKILALAMSFSFICMWHGMGTAIITWTTLNFCNALLEKIVTLPLRKFHSFSDKSLVHKFGAAIICFPLFLIMCLSTCFFLTNFEIGLLIFKRTLLNGIIPLLPASVMMFCGCCVGEDVYKYKFHSRKYKLHKKLAQA